jgi:hypothetical protein
VLVRLPSSLPVKSFINLMIVFFEYGRLGNQLFQYATLKELFPKERFFFYGCGDLKNTLALVDATVIENEKMTHWVRNRLRQLLLSLSTLRIIGKIGEQRADLTYSIKIRRGLVPGCYLLMPSFFQHEDIVSRLNPKFEIRRALNEKAFAWLKLRNISSKSKNLVFVHIRRSDYLSWPSREFPAVLDKSWYLRAIEQIRSTVDKPLFLLLTDDIYYAEDCFGDQPDIFISDNDTFVDLALMSLCSHGILSASSFAWWGAWFSRKARKDQKQGVYLAPKYWAGHRSQEWHPQGFISDWIKYIE